MKDFITILIEKTRDFGNHYRKHIQVVQKYYEDMRDRIEVNKKRELVHFLHPAYNFPEELKIVGAVAEGKEEKLKFIGTYFALHLLWMNRQLIEMLMMELLHSNHDRFSIYKNFMREAGNRFRFITATYLSELLKIFIKDIDPPAYAIMGVGTKSDQDDIDVGIIDDGSGDRVGFNRVIARINQEMLKYATSLHFHLSEHIGAQHYSASIDEYKKALKTELRDFVIINEMLGAALIIGDERLFNQFQKEIISRYFFSPKGDNKFHEGYLRGIVGEVRTLLAKPLVSGHINFKDDALRPIKSIISAKKTIFDIHKVNAWDIIDELRKFDLKRVGEYETLEQALTFVEIFRYLYQMLVAQDEEIIIDENSLKNIRKVARILGYTDIGSSSAERHLLVHYYEHITNLRKVIPILCDDIKDHLKTISNFIPLFDPIYSGNLAVDFIKKFKFFRGTSFWDDVLDVFKNTSALNRFVSDFQEFPTERQKDIVRSYIGWLKYDLYTLLTFLTLLGEGKNSFSIFKVLNQDFLRILKKNPEMIRNILFIFHRYPQLVNKYLGLNDSKDLIKLKSFLQERLYEEELRLIFDELINLINIHLTGSQFFKRYFNKVCERYPQVLRMLKNPRDLKEFAEGIYNVVNSMRTFTEKREKLGDYYDIEMVRVSIATLGGTPTQITNTEFIEFADQYMRTLYDICREEVDREFNRRIVTEDVLAIFASGGHAREQAFDDDYDLIVILNSEDPDLLNYSNRVVSKMNAEIIKRGTIPHHRFAEYFGRFVIKFQEIEELLSEERPDIFIEQSQILGARLIIGSRRFERDFLNSILQKKIFNRKEIYIKQMLKEIHSRHPTEKEFINSEIDIKECSGGLRDIEMLLLILKAYFEITEPVNSRLFELLSHKLPQLMDDLTILQNNFYFIKRIRDIYRLTIGASDSILTNNLSIIGSIIGISENNGLYNKLFEVLRETRGVIKRLLNQLFYKEYANGL
uniref:PII-uridylyltransferase/Glutamine-synthetase adenylyltransferase domain-containing protein n=1 Tax=candidate division WOR-3 bacterium TaxID=2052148 RepID=A0A7V3VTP8_UNCW3